MSVKLWVPEASLEYAMVTPGGDPDELSEFVGYREGSGSGVAGTFVPGSNNGWQLQATVGLVQIYVRWRPT